MEQTVVEAEGLAERRPLGAEAAMIGRMGGIAAQFDAGDRLSGIAGGDADLEAAAHTAVGAGGASAVGLIRRMVHDGSRGLPCQLQAACSVPAPSWAQKALPKISSSRSPATDVPFWIRSKYQLPSFTAPWRTAPISRSSCSTSFL